MRESATAILDDKVAEFAFHCVPAGENACRLAQGVKRCPPSGRKVGGDWRLGELHCYEGAAHLTPHAAKQRAGQRQDRSRVMAELVDGRIRRPRWRPGVRRRGIILMSSAFEILG